jgi:hypothetical protein
MPLSQTHFWSLRTFIFASAALLALLERSKKGCVREVVGRKMKKGRKSQRSMENWEISVGWENGQ